jgi:hypothetical protein
MRKKNVWNGIALLFAAMTVLALAGCPQEAEETVFSDDAGLQSITLNDVDGTLPAAVSKEDWEDSSFDIALMTSGYFLLPNDTNLEDVTVTATTSHGGAKVQYGQGTNNEAPVNWNKTGRFYDLSKSSVLYITIMSESGAVRNYYKVRLILQADETTATLSRFEVNGSGVKISSDPVTDITQAVPVAVWVDSTLSAPAQITVVPDNENATITTALVKRGNESGNAVFYDATSYEVDEGDVVYVKCVSFDETVTQYYAALMRIYNHITLTIGGKTVEEIGQGGDAGNTANFGSVTLTGTEAAAGAVIKASPRANTEATVTGYQLITTGSGGTPTEEGWVAPDGAGSYTTGTAIPLTTTAVVPYLCIRIEDKFQHTYYYRVYILVQSSAATASAIRIGGVNASALGTPQAAPWAGTDNTGTVIIPPREASPAQTTVVVTGTNGAVGSWAKAADVNAIPADADFSNGLITGGLTKDQYLFVKVVSQDGSATQYYKILISEVKNDVVALQSVTIDTAEASTIGIGGTAVNVGAGGRGAIGISAAQAAAGTVIKATPAEDSGATITGYAVVANNINNPTFVETGIGNGYTTGVAITNGQHLFVRVQAENGTAYYYRIVITILSGNANLTAITVGGTAASSLGTPQTAPWAGTDNTGTVIIPPLDASPNSTSVAVTSSNSVVASWAKAADANAIPADGDFKTGVIVGGLAKDQYLFVKAVSSDGTVTQYYKILISDVKSNVVTLASVSIGSVSMDGGYAGAGGTTANVGANYRGGIAIPAAAAVIGTRIKATPLAGSNATITGYAVVASTQNNPTFENPDGNGEFVTTAVIATTNHLFIRVQAQTGTVHYYRIIITIPALSALTVGGTNSTSVGTPRNAPWAGTEDTGTIVIPPSAAAPNAASIATTAVPASATTGIPSAGVPVRTWAVAANASAIPAENDFSSTTPIAAGLAVGNYVFVKVVSSDSTVTQYYKILVSDIKKNITTLAGVTIDTVDAASIGTGGTAVNVAAGGRGAITISAAQAAAGIVIKATPTEDSGATITGYAVVANNVNNPTFVETGIGNGYTTGAAITNNQHLFIRVQAENGTVYYYRIVITVSSGS